METTVRATCPKCQTVLRIPAQWVGQAVKCKKCGALVRSKAKTDDAAAVDTAPHTPLPPPVAVPQPNSFDFSQPSADDDDFFQMPGAAPAPAPLPVSPPALDAYGNPLPPAYPYAPPPGYPYAPQPGAYPYPMPPG